MKIIGVNNDMYISSACLIDNGKVVAAAAEERFNRDKLSRVFPKKAIGYCLRTAGAGIGDIDYMALSWNPAVYLSKFNPLFSGQRRHLIEHMYSVPDNLMDFYGRPASDYMYQEFGDIPGKLRIYYITHHRCHAANAFLMSPFKRAAILTADAQGEFESTTFCVGRGKNINLLKKVNYPHSLGVLYSAFTEYLGFRPNLDEWKIMGMAAYSNGMNKFYKTMKDSVIKLSRNGEFELDLSMFKGYLCDQPRQFTEKMERHFGPARKKEEDLEERHFEIAAALQKISEDAAAHLLNWLYKETGEKNLALGGGFFLNSVFNGKALELTPFKKIFISSCPDDSGNCFGAAYYLYNHILKKDRGETLRHNYFGPSFSDEEIKTALEEFKIPFSYEADVCGRVAQYVSEGRIVGWFQGRMEFGQRALGNRSILADPRRAEMKDRINMAVKFRENFRPFAPAVLEDEEAGYFKVGAGGSAPFMEKVYPVNKKKAREIPAVVHVDGSCRLQTVYKATNPLFYSLICEFRRITGVPVILNTSFNLNDEPIVCTPKDAVRTFCLSGMDVLAIGNYIVEKGCRQ